MTKKHPRFFCENCGNEVKKNTKVCPHCGRFFASIKCPSCDFIGNDNDFKDGCPKCGYAINKEIKKPETNNEKSIKQQYVDDERLPFWIYIMALSLFFLVVFIILK